MQLPDRIDEKMLRAKREEEFQEFLKKRVKEKSADSYIRELKNGFEKVGIKKYDSIFDVYDPNYLSDLEKTKELRKYLTSTRRSGGGTPGMAGLNKYIEYLKQRRDSYYMFMEAFNISYKDLIQWGIDNIIFPPIKEVDDEWRDLKNRIEKNEKVFIRGYKRDAKGTNSYQEFYKFSFGNENVCKDPTNNDHPQRIIKKLTGLNRNTNIFNYQVSHIWGRTKNIYLFEAPWNICYVPKIIDPFTGHEAMGEIPRDFSKCLRATAQEKYRKYIDDYNELISKKNIDCELEKFRAMQIIDDVNFFEDAKNELSPIEIIK